MSNGDPKCELCHGRGALDLPPDENGIPRTQRCECVLIRDVVRNVERGWKKLIRAPVLNGPSPLTENEAKDLWVTASMGMLQTHLRHVAVRMGPDWGFKVVTDSDLMVAWLANASMKGERIFDPEAQAPVSQEVMTLVDLMDPPELLIIRLGVKSARNAAMNEVFLEALTHRAHAGKPTWIVDSPQQPLGEGHLCWSYAVSEFLVNWTRVNLGVSPEEFLANSFTPASDLSLTPTGNGANTGGTKRVTVPGIETPTTKDRWSKKKQ